MLATSRRARPRAPFEAANTTDTLAGPSADILAGIIGGLAGAWTMNHYHTLIARLQEPSRSGDDSHADQPGSQGGREDSAQNIGGEEQSSEPATERAATAVITGLLGRPLSKNQKKRAGNITHYAFGASVGGLYGALAQAAPPVRTGLGLPYGALVWLIADEAAVPALGLSDPPHKHPLSTHASALGAHLVFGITLELVRRIVRRIL